MTGTQLQRKHAGLMGEYEVLRDKYKLVLGDVLRLVDCDDGNFTVCHTSECAVTLTTDKVPTWYANPAATGTCPECDCNRMDVTSRLADLSGMARNDPPPRRQ